MKVYQEFEKRLEERYRKLYGGKSVRCENRKSPQEPADQMRGFRNVDLRGRSLRSVIGS